RVRRPVAAQRHRQAAEEQADRTRVLSGPARRVPHPGRWARRACLMDVRPNGRATGRYHRPMARSLSAALLGAALLISAPTTAAAAPPAGGPEPGPPASVDTVYIPVEVGDDDERCVIVADVYRPARADAQTPVPAVLTTHGFGGSKDSQAGLARALAGRGYAVLAYSGL